MVEALQALALVDIMAIVFGLWAGVRLSHYLRQRSKVEAKPEEKVERPYADYWYEAQEKKKKNNPDND